MENTQNLLVVLPEDDKNRLNLIKQEVTKFLQEQSTFTYFVRQDPGLIERLHLVKLYELVAELPEAKRLDPKEMFIISAASWLYEIGLQSKDLKDIIGDAAPPYTDAQKRKIWQARNQLSYNMLLKAFAKSEDAALQLPLYRNFQSEAIAQICRDVTSDKTLNEIDDEFLLEGGVNIRLRLIVALLRLADQFNIDSTRIDVNILEKMQMPVFEKARWWAYHHTLTFPLQHGRMRFQYNIPYEQKGYVNHIRALVEPQFRIVNNETMRYLLEQHNVRLQLDHQHEIKYPTRSQWFGQNIPNEVIRHLEQEITPLPGLPEPGPPFQPQDEVSVVIVDYENLILQLGKSGNFLNENQQYETLLNMLAELNKLHVGSKKFLIAAHWEQPHLKTIREQLTQAFEIYDVEDRVDTASSLTNALEERFRQGKISEKLLFITPSISLNKIFRQVNSRQPTYVWITDLKENIPYKLNNNNHNLNDLLDLKAEARLGEESQNLIETECLYWLIDRQKDSFTWSELEHGLRTITGVNNSNLSFYAIWLQDQKVLSYYNSVYHFKPDNTQVVTLIDQRKSLIETMSQLTSNTSSNIAQSVLISSLSDSIFPDKDKLLDLFAIFHRRQLLYKQKNGDDVLFGLNERHLSVVQMNRDLYITLYIIGIDHISLTMGYSYLLLNSMARDVSNYLSPAFFQPIFEYAKEKKVIKVGTDRQNRETIMLNTRNEAVWSTLLKVDIIFNELHRNKIGYERLSLLQRLEEIPRFDYDASEVRSILRVLESERLLDVQKNDVNYNRDIIRLRTEDRLVKLIIGRWNITGLIKNMRILARKKPTSADVIDALAKYVVKNNKEVAGWVFDYGKWIKVLDFKEEDNKHVVELRRNHSVLRIFGARENRVKSEMKTLFEKNKVHKQKGGWVQEHHLRSAMEKDVDAFGYLHEEHQYWIDLCVHRNVLQRNVDRQGKQKRHKKIYRLQ